MNTNRIPHVVTYVYGIYPIVANRATVSKDKPSSVFSLKYVPKLSEHDPEKSIPWADDAFSALTGGRNDVRLKEPMYICGRRLLSELPTPVLDSRAAVK